MRSRNSVVVIHIFRTDENERYVYGIRKKREKIRFYLRFNFDFGIQHIQY